MFTLGHLVQTPMPQKKLEEKLLLNFQKQNPSIHPSSSTQPGRGCRGSNLSMDAQTLLTVWYF